jgi:hypothetical protein
MRKVKLTDHVKYMILKDIEMDGTPWSWMEAML